MNGATCADGCGTPRPVKYRVQRHECEGWTVYDANTGHEFAAGFETSQEAWNYVAGLIGSCPISRAAAGGPAVVVPDVGKRRWPSLPAKE